MKLLLISNSNSSHKNEKALEIQKANAKVLETQKANAKVLEPQKANAKGLEPQKANVKVKPEKHDTIKMARWSTFKHSQAQLSQGMK